MNTFAMILFFGGLIVAVCAFIANILTMTGIIPTRNSFKSFGVGMIFFVLGGLSATAGFYLGAFNFVKQTILPLLVK